MDYLKQFRVAPGSHVRLKDFDPQFRDKHEKKESVFPEVRRYKIHAIFTKARRELRSMKAPTRYNTWVIPLSYAVAAGVLGLGFPRLEVRILH
jgi:hypothetical protein